jgi:hypothetical protein
LERKFDTDLENMARQQKREIEKLEMVQQKDLIHATKKLKNDQVCSWDISKMRK